MQRLAANNIKATVQFFGSARALDRLQYDKKHAALTAALAMPESSEALTAAVALKKLEAMEWMIEYLEKTRELARRLTEWSMRSRLSRDAACINGVSRSKSIAELDELDDEDSSSATKSLSEEKRASSFTYLPHATDSRSNADSDLRGGLFVCTGGAGGFMEAANRGAADVPGGRSIGMGISLPFETGLNPFGAHAVSNQCPVIPSTGRRCKRLLAPAGQPRGHAFDSCFGQSRLSLLSSTTTSLRESCAWRSTCRHSWSRRAASARATRCLR